LAAENIANKHTKLDISAGASGVMERFKFSLRRENWHVVNELSRHTRAITEYSVWFPTLPAAGDFCHSLISTESTQALCAFKSS
jgi:hypothetical protein